MVSVSIQTVTGKNIVVPVHGLLNWKMTENGKTFIKAAIRNASKPLILKVFLDSSLDKCKDKNPQSYAEHMFFLTFNINVYKGIRRKKV